MKIIVNGETREVAGKTTAAALLELLGVRGIHVAVEINRKVVPRALLDRAEIAEGDRIEIVSFVGGG